jgi:hypothetical protein
MQQKEMRRRYRSLGVGAALFVRKLDLEYSGRKDFDNRPHLPPLKPTIGEILSQRNDIEQFDRVCHC